MGVVGLMAALLGAGCTKTTLSVPSNGTNQVSTVSVPDVQLMCGVAKSAAYLGTSVWLYGLPPGLAGHPQDREAFETARTSIKALIAAGSFTSGDLSAALQALPIKELQGESGTIVVGEAVILWDTYGRQLANLDKTRVFETYLLPVATALCQGLDMALPKP